MPKAMALMSKFRDYAPEFTGPSSPEESVADMMHVINNSTISTGNSGAFISHLGSKRWL